MGKCVRHGIYVGRDCLACKAEKERRERANMMLVGFVGLLVLLALTTDWWVPLLFGR